MKPLGFLSTCSFEKICLGSRSIASPENFSTTYLKPESPLLYCSGDSGTKCSGTKMISSTCICSGTKMTNQLGLIKPTESIILSLTTNEVCSLNKSSQCVVDSLGTDSEK